MPLKESAGASGQWMVISMLPDVCKSPVAPVPYPIVGVLSNAVNQSPDVKFSGFPVFTNKARITTVVGDEAGVGGGVKSLVNKGFCRPLTHNPTLRVNGNHVLNHQMAMFEMNCAGPEGPGNTIGTLVYSAFMGFVNVSPAGKVPPSSAITAETTSESSFADSLMSKVGGIEGAISKAKQAYGLATMDWSNPGAVLGAIGGIAGAGGMGDLAKAAGRASQAYNFATTDWSNPGAVMGAAVNMGGQVIGAASSLKSDQKRGRTAAQS